MEKAPSNWYLRRCQIALPSSSSFGRCGCERSLFCHQSVRLIARRLSQRSEQTALTDRLANVGSVRQHSAPGRAERSVGGAQDEGNVPPSKLLGDRGNEMTANVGIKDGDIWIRSAQNAQGF